uniref:alanyl-tRNA editing protein n=1 Tax=Eubacterium cellulosolvens TaxID=29322 RepID=UPI000482045E|nr:alanyl-tRNA editing protein [[Eubacterium] cellulosolvens]
MEQFNEAFYEDEKLYERGMTAVVRNCQKGRKRHEIRLDESCIFYPEGGGQPGDRGELIFGTDMKSVRVLDTKREGQNIVLYTDGPVDEGTEVLQQLDWDFRFSNMQGHSGEHIFSGIVHRKFGYNNVGFHMGDTIRVDFDGTLTPEQIREVESEANRFIWKNEPIEITVGSEEEVEDIDYRSKKALDGKIRLVMIPGADICACCGLHVRRTGEIGVIKCISAQNYKGGVRLELLCGAKALSYLQSVEDQNSQIARELSVKPEESALAVVRLRNDLLEEKQKAAANMNRYFRARAAGFLSEDEGGLRIDFEDEMSVTDIRRFCDWILKQGYASVACVLAPRNPDDVAEGWNYTIGTKDASTLDLRAKAKELNEVLDGRGGGSPEMIQGSFAADKDRIAEVLKKCLL